MTHDEDQDGLAAEYVLGTLDAQERAQAEARIAAEPDFAALVQSWERRLGELHAMVDPVEPPSVVWDKVRAAVAGAEGRAEMRLPQVPAAAAAPAPAAPERTAEVIALASRAKRWRGVAAATSALAAALLLFVAIREMSPLPEPGSAEKPAGRFVAVLQQSATAPAFLLTVDVDTKTFTVRRVGASPEAGKSFELWLVSERFPQPRSLGVIGSDDFTTRAALAAFDPDTINKATYAVSLEPEGGSPTGVPTGPVLYVGNLIEATPP
jgi:anti-sigma-K factor RskA